MSVNDADGGSGAAEIRALSPLDIERVDVLKFGSGAAYGSRGANGVIAIYTKRLQDNHDHKKLNFYDYHTVPFKPPGFSSNKRFASPNYNTHNEFMHPDYRSTIYWNPSVITDGKSPAVVSFFTADNTTQYRIVVEGVTADGEPVRTEKIIRVENP
jgi:TonB-dependent SusC/RagA subfamily outer membrane receptor